MRVGSTTSQYNRMSFGRQPKPLTKGLQALIQSGKNQIDGWNQAAAELAKKNVAKPDSRKGKLFARTA